MSVHLLQRAKELGYQRELPRRLLLVLLGVAFRADDDGLCDRSNAELVGDRRFRGRIMRPDGKAYSRRTFEDAMADLTAAGVIVHTGEWRHDDARIPVRRLDLNALENLHKTLHRIGGKSPQSSTRAIRNARVRIRRDFKEWGYNAQRAPRVVRAPLSSGQVEEPRRVVGGDPVQAWGPRSPEAHGLEPGIEPSGYPSLNPTAALRRSKPTEIDTQTMALPGMESDVRAITEAKLVKERNRIINAQKRLRKRVSRKGWRKLPEYEELTDARLLVGLRVGLTRDQVEYQWNRLKDHDFKQEKARDVDLTWKNWISGEYGPVVKARRKGIELDILDGFKIKPMAGVTTKADNGYAFGCRKCRVVEYVRGEKLSVERKQLYRIKLRNYDLVDCYRCHSLNEIGDALLFGCQLVDEWRKKTLMRKLGGVDL